MASDVIRRVAWEIVGFLESRGIAYSLIGGLAVQVWGRVRSTLDVDVLVLLSPAELDSLALHLASAGFRARRPNAVHIGGCALLQLAFEEQGALVDVRVDILAAGTQFHELVVARRVAIELNNKHLYVPRCEDLILLKLLAGRPIDQIDARELYRMNATELDLDHLRCWADRLGVREQLDECMSADGDA